MASAALALVACGSTAVSAPRTVPTDQRFVLGVSESVRIAAPGQALQLGLQGVVSDSRCPKGEQCLHAGEARVRLWVQQGDAPRQFLELVQRPPMRAQALAWPAHRLELLLLDVEPAPVSGRPIDASAYRVMLSVQKDGSGAAPQ